MGCQDIVQLRPVERCANDRFQQERGIVRFDVLDAQSMAMFVHHHVAQTDGVVRSATEEAAIVSVEHHVAMVGEVIVGERVAAALAIDRMPTDAHVGSDAQQTCRPLGRPDVLSRVVRFVPIIQARHLAPTVERILEQRKPRTRPQVGVVRVVRIAAVPVVKFADEVAVGCVLIVAPGNPGSIGNEAPGDRRRITLGKPTTVGRGTGPTLGIQLIRRSHVSAGGHERSRQRASADAGPSHESAPTASPPGTGRGDARTLTCGRKVCRRRRKSDPNPRSPHPL